MEFKNQKQLFRYCGIKRGLFSEVSGRPVPGIPSNFHHILPKGRFTKAKLDPFNIVILTAEEHNTWHNDKDSLLFLPKWQWVFKREEELLKQYL